jgi:hypothetical protein
MLVKIICPRCEIGLYLRTADERMPRHGIYIGSDLFACKRSGEKLLIKIGNHYHPLLNPMSDPCKEESPPD